MIPGVNITSTKASLVSVNRAWGLGGPEPLSRGFMYQKLMWIEVHIYCVKAKSQAGNIWDKYIMTTQKDQSLKKISKRS